MYEFVNIELPATTIAPTEAPSGITHCSNALGLEWE